MLAFLLKQFAARLELRFASQPDHASRIDKPRRLETLEGFRDFDAQVSRLGCSEALVSDIITTVGSIVDSSRLSATSVYFLTLDRLRTQEVGRSGQLLVEFTEQPQKYSVPEGRVCFRFITCQGYDHDTTLLSWINALHEHHGLNM